MKTPQPFSEAITEASIRSVEWFFSMRVQDDQRQRILQWGRAVGGGVYTLLIGIVLLVAAGSAWPYIAALLR